MGVIFYIICAAAVFLTCSQQHAVDVLAVASSKPRSRSIPPRPDTLTLPSIVKALYFSCCVAVMLFQEVWGKSFCRTIEKLVEVVQEYPGEVEHIFSPACVPLVRCAGCCGDENLECHPTLTSNTTMQIKPAEQGQEYVEMTFVEDQFCSCNHMFCIVTQLCIDIVDMNIEHKC
uniref:Placental growth factor b n=1 Tax=Sinocyclocheilus rhinocerous TaxID=307959 RepID=A0A673JUE3_9TELE